MARPQRIVLVRHGESEGNADDTGYEREPDHALGSPPPVCGRPGRPGWNCASSSATSG
ncbi:hypothetical protein H0E86_28285 [Streptomyces sp. SCSIO-PteL053]|nr:hypothetical protein H0E86_28285 [Streptomyces sp. SCSIO-PteL053]